MNQNQIVYKIEKIEKSLDGGLLKKSLFERIRNNLRTAQINLTTIALLGVGVLNFANAQEKEEAIAKASIDINQKVKVELVYARKAIEKNDLEFAGKILNHILVISQKIKDPELTEEIDEVSSMLEKEKTNPEIKTYNDSMIEQNGDTIICKFLHMITRIKSSDAKHNSDRIEMYKKQIEKILSSRNKPNEKITVTVNYKKDYVELLGWKRI